MKLSRGVYLSVLAALIAAMSATPLRGSSEEEMYRYERQAAFAARRAAMLKQRARNAEGAIADLLEEAADNMKALAEIKAEIAREIRAGADEKDLAALKRTKAELSQKEQALIERLKEKRVLLAEEAGEAHPPEHRAEPQPGVVFLDSVQRLRNWLNEEEARDGAK